MIYQQSSNYQTRFFELKELCLSHSAQLCCLQTSGGLMNSFADIYIL